jgi:hypothetical protein
MVTASNAARVALDGLGPLGAELGAGGQGKVFALPRSPSLVYKEYSQDTLDRLDSKALSRMVELPATLPADDRAALLERAAWPLTVVERNGRPSGFLMVRVPSHFHTRVRFPRGYSERLGETQLLLNDKDYLKDRDLAVSDSFRLEFLHDVAFALELFHRLEVVVGDLSPNNLLFSRSGRPRCFFIDCDAMRVRGASVLPQIETVDWQVPGSGESLGTRAGDAYKFALLGIRLFAGDQSTTDPAPLLRAGPRVHELAGRGLSPQASQRPAPAEWRPALTGTTAPPRQTAPVRQTPPVRVVPGSAPRGGPTVPAPAPAASPVVPRPRRHWLGAAGTALQIRLLRIRARNAITLAVLVALVGYGVPHAAEVENWVREATRTVTELAVDHGQEQADSVAVLLTASARSRKDVKAAVQDVIKCRRLKPAAAKLGKASADRRAAAERAGRLEIDDLAAGEQLKTLLVTAFRHSKGADDAYRKWAQALSREGCGGKARKGADRRRGDAESAKATAAKKKVATLWNTIGPSYGHPEVTYQTI